MTRTNKPKSGAVGCNGPRFILDELMNKLTQIVLIALIVVVSSCNRTEPNTGDVEINRNQAWKSDPSSVEARVSLIISEQLGISQESFALSDPLMNTLGADELDLVELTMEIEEEFDISIPESVFADPKNQSGGVYSQFSGQDFVDAVRALLEKK